MKIKLPEKEWLDYIYSNYYYIDGKVFSTRSAYSKPVGSQNSSKYLCVSIEPKRCTPRKVLNVKLHQLVWFLNTDTWPDKEIDHINRQILDNRFENLRLSNRCLQATNRNNFKDRDEKFHYIQKYKGGYRVVKNRKPLGTFKTLEEAMDNRDKLIANIEK